MGQTGNLGMRVQWPYKYIGSKCNLDNWEPSQLVIEILDQKNKDYENNMLRKTNPVE